MFSLLSSVVRKNKKIILPLLLLTSAVLVGCDYNATSSSSGSNASSTTSSGSSSEEFNGSEVPNWDLENPTISAASSGLDLGLTMTYFGRYEENNILYTGNTQFEGSTNINIGYRTYLIVNQKTGTEVFRWELDPGETYVTWAKTNLGSNSWYNDRYTIQGDTLYISFRITLQNQYNAPDSRLGGDYQPFVDYVNTNFSTQIPDINSRLGRSYRFLFTLNMTTDAITILIGAAEDYNVDLQDIYADGNVLYSVLAVNKGMESQNPFASLLPLPSDVPTLIPSNKRYSVIFQSDLTDLSVISTHTLAASTDVYVYLNNFRRGFDVMSFDLNGNLFMNMNMSFNVSSRTEIATRINSIETTLLSSNQLAAFKAEQIPVIENYYDLLQDEITTISNFNFNVNITGGFNFTTNQLATVFGGSNFYFYTQNGTSYEGNRWQQYFEYENEGFVVENDRFIIRDETQGYYNWYSMPSIYNVSKIYRLNLETLAKTLLLESTNQGVSFTAVYRYTQGFYVTGIYNESPEYTTGLGKSEAFLRAYNTSFTKTGEVVLSGSEQDNSNGIILDETGKPVWLVSSNSNDGDFAAVGSTNTTNLFRQYYVRFN